MNETKSWFFEKINKSNKPLARLIKKKKRGGGGGGGRAQIKKLEMKKGEVISNSSTETQRTIRDYYR